MPHNKIKWYRLVFPDGNSCMCLSYQEYLQYFCNILLPQGYGTVYERDELYCMSLKVVQLRAAE